MFQDAQEELERLEDALLEEEEYEDISAYNNDPADIDLDDLSQQLLQPQPKSYTGFATFMVIITLVIVSLVTLWVLRRMGVL